MEDKTGSLASGDIRVQAEMDIEEFLYYIVSVKDALIQEIDNELHLGLEPKEINLDAINRELNQKETGAKGITKEIDDRVSNEHNNPLWLVNELDNDSKHRHLVGQEIAIENGRLARASLIDSRTGEGMRTGDGTRILATFYLEESYTGIEDLQRTVRKKVREYLNNIREGR